MVSFINVMNRLFAVLFSLCLLMTGGVNRLFCRGAAEYVGETDVIGAESLVRSQGVTNDGQSFLFSGKNALERVSADGKQVLAINTRAIPKELADRFGSEHIGGISYYDGVLYAAVEDSDQWQHPLIVLYDAETLDFTGKYFELPTSLQKRGVPWVAADGEHGWLYTGDSRNYTEIYRFDIATGEYLGTVTLSQEIVKIQGGEYYNGLLYFGSNDLTRACYSVDPATGETTKLFDRITYEPKLIDNFGGEGEDLTVFPMEDGTWLHTLQTGALFVDVTLRHYR